MDNKRMKKSTKYLIISILVLFLSIIGASMAYYLARVQATLSGRAAGTELDLTITKLSTNANDDLIPLDNDLETLGQAALGYENNGSCVDINGYSVCQIYKVTITNNGTVSLTMNGTVTLSGTNVPNIDCAKMDDENTITSNNSCKSGMFVEGDTLNANSSNNYYVMVYIKNLDEQQSDSGEFNGTVTFTTEDGRKVKGRFTKPFNLTNHITNLYNDAAKTVVTANGEDECSEFDQWGSCIAYTVTKTIDYNYATSVNLMNDRLGGTTISLDGGNIRYYGAEPNNYIDIGDKYEEDYTYPVCLEQSKTGCLLEEIRTIYAGTPILWRIIGVFDGKLRIIRDTSIGSYSFDASTLDVNDDGGINEWSQADIMKLLNPGYENNLGRICETTGSANNRITTCSEDNDIIVNNSLWWNSGSGNCYYYGYNNYIKSCDFTNFGLSDEAKEYVTDQTLYLGGFDTDGVFTNQAYTIERSSNVIQNPSDGVARTISWTGKVGLIYPSDYGYAVDFRDSNCQGNLYSFDNCTENWMYQNFRMRTISPSATIASREMTIDRYSFGNYIVIENTSIHPTLLLDSSVLAESGNGSKETPYVVAY